jgi:hypothetical protein
MSTWTNLSKECRAITQTTSTKEQKLKLPVGYKHFFLYFTKFITVTISLEDEKTGTTPVSLLILRKSSVLMHSLTLKSLTLYLLKTLCNLVRCFFISWVNSLLSRKKYHLSKFLSPMDLFRQGILTKYCSTKYWKHLYSSFSQLYIVWENWIRTLMNSSKLIAEKL